MVFSQGKEHRAPTGGGEGPKYQEAKYMGKLVVTIGFIAILLAGCAHDAGLVQQSTISSRSGVFQGISGIETAGPGTILTITESLKTPKPGIYPYGVQTYGTPDYKLVVNIDGQALWLDGKPRPEYIEQTLAHNPDEGDGIRYRFAAILKISGGEHHVIVALPDEGVALEKTVTLEEGRENFLHIEPVYGGVTVRSRPAHYGGTSFIEGIHGFMMNLNGRTAD